MSQTRELLSKLFHQPWKVMITRNFPGDPRHNGFVQGLGEKLVLIQKFHDFYVEGYSILRVKDIKRVRSGKHERFWEKMIRAEGIMQRVGISYEVPLESYRSIFDFFCGRGQHIIVECESRTTEDDSEFLIGLLHSVYDESASILNFDALGNWDEEPTEVAYNDITQVQFDTPYINTISKYLKERPATNRCPRA